MLKKIEKEDTWCALTWAVARAPEPLQPGPPVHPLWGPGPRSVTAQNTGASERTGSLWSAEGRKEEERKGWERTGKSVTQSPGMTQGEIVWALLSHISHTFSRN